MGQGLTKEQKLEMVSKAIDAGFDVQLFSHFGSYEKAMNNLEIFEGLSVRYVHADKQAWVKINDENEYNDKFSASIHL